MSVSGNSVTQPRLWIALLHYPVLNRQREVITTAITNLDVHDIARSARTYNVKSYYIVTPIARQRELADRIVDHWRTGPGANRVPERGEALSLVKTAETLDAVVEDVAAAAQEQPLVVATCARPGRATIGFDGLADILAQGRPVLALLGTGWGLADEVLRSAHHVLEPITGANSDYNHLSVRCAASVMLDRLLGNYS